MDINLRYSGGELSLLSSNQITVKQQEARTLNFYFKTSAGAAINISAYSFEFAVQYRLNPTGMLIEKDNDDFTNGGATGMASVTLSTTDLALMFGTYTAELKVTIGSEVVKAPDLKFRIEKTYTDDVTADQSVVTQTVTVDPGEEVTFGWTGGSSVIFWQSENNPNITGWAFTDENGVRWYQWFNAEGGIQRSQTKP